MPQKMFKFYIYYNFFKDAQSTNCVGSDHTSGIRMEYEECNPKPCPVWTDWNPRSGGKCSASCGGGMLEEVSDCVLANATSVATCDGKFERKTQNSSFTSYSNC